MFRFIIVGSLLGVSWGASLSKTKISIKHFPSGPPGDKIVGGTPINITEVPYQVSLESSGLQFCAGSIISPNFILSAAHCVEHYQPNEITIRYGSGDHEHGGTTVKAKKLIPHEQHSIVTYDYDVSVIELETPIQFSNSAKPIKIAEEEPVAGSTVRISGWGVTQQGGEAPDQLHTIQVPIIDHETCESDYRSIHPLTDRMFCAGLTGHGSCNGDSGGAAVQNDTVVGIVSWGHGCAIQGYPGVYTNVANIEIRKFIRDNANV